MRSTDRLLSILETLQDGQPRPLSSLATSSGLPKSTALRFLRSLERRGWVQRMDDHYALGPAVVTLAQRYLSSASPALLAVPAMQALRDRLGETVSLSAVSGGARVCIQELSSPHELRYVHNVGSVGPLHAGASGRILLAHMAPAERARVLAGRLPRYTGRTLTTKARILEECELARRRGWAISRGEKTAGSVAIAVPVRIPGSSATYALAVFAPQIRYRPEDRLAWIRGLRDCAERIARGSPGASGSSVVA